MYYMLGIMITMYSTGQLYIVVSITKRNYTLTPFYFLPPIIF